MCNFCNQSTSNSRNSLKMFPLDRHLGMHFPLGSKSQEGIDVYPVQLHVVLRVWLIIFNYCHHSTQQKSELLHCSNKFQHQRKLFRYSFLKRKRGTKIIEDKSKPGGQKNPFLHSPDGSESLLVWQKEPLGQGTALGDPSGQYVPFKHGPPVMLLTGQAHG